LINLLRGTFGTNHIHASLIRYVTAARRPTFARSSLALSFLFARISNLTLTFIGTYAVEEVEEEARGRRGHVVVKLTLYHLIIGGGDPGVRVH